LIKGEKDLHNLKTYSIDKTPPILPNDQRELEALERYFQLKKMEPLETLRPLGVWIDFDRKDKGPLKPIVDRDIVVGKSLNQGLPPLPVMEIGHIFNPSKSSPENSPLKFPKRVKLPLKGNLFSKKEESIEQSVENDPFPALDGTIIPDYDEIETPKKEKISNPMLDVDKGPFSEYLDSP